VHAFENSAGQHDLSLRLTDGLWRSLVLAALHTTINNKAAERVELPCQWLWFERSIEYTIGRGAGTVINTVQKIFFCCTILHVGVYTVIEVRTTCNSSCIEHEGHNLNAEC
jgi:hypothetical protein